MKSEIKAPAPWMMLLEWRAPWEMAATMASWPLLTRMQQGDGHPVIVFPGLAAGDLSTVPLRNFLRAMNYEAFPWNFGLNLGPRSGVVAGCIEHAREIAERHGSRVSLIGWSLGGIYAREVAKRIPGHVRSVITLGTPFAGSSKLTNAHRLFRMVSGIDPDNHPDVHRIRELPPVPTTSILSRTDGVVAWEASVNPHSELSETIEITASHLGMGANPLAFHAIADRLAQPSGRWQPFRAEGLRQYFFRTGHEPVVHAKSG